MMVVLTHRVRALATRTRSSEAVTVLCPLTSTCQDGERRNSQVKPCSHADSCPLVQPTNRRGLVVFDAPAAAQDAQKEAGCHVVPQVVLLHTIWRDRS